MIRVKICGICRPGDAEAAAAAGADYVGVILHGESPRRRSLAVAAGIFRAAEGIVQEAAPGTPGSAPRRVGVFVDASQAEVRRAGDRLRLDAIQLHGDESGEYVAGIREAGPWRVWKAVRPHDGIKVTEAILRFHGIADALLVDGWNSERAGGTGTRFDWDAIKAARGDWPAGLEFIAAGGLEPANVADAIRRLMPDVVDVSSGVEEATCRKSPEKIRAFVENARKAAIHGGVPGAGGRQTPDPGDAAAAGDGRD